MGKTMGKPTTPPDSATRPTTWAGPGHLSRRQGHRATPPGLRDSEPHRVPELIHFDAPLTLTGLKSRPGS